MVRYAAEFGMTPSARVRLAIYGGGAAASKWAGLIGSVETGWVPSARQPYSLSGGATLGMPDMSEAGTVSISSLTVNMPSSVYL